MTDRDVDAAVARLTVLAGSYSRRFDETDRAAMQTVLGALVEARQTHAEYVEQHEHCVQETMDDMVRTHDEIESKRDGIERELAEARLQLAAQAQEVHKLTGQNELRKKQIARFPFCSDHRDKVFDLSCRECKREKAERQLATQAQEIARLQDQLMVINSQVLANSLDGRIEDAASAQREPDAKIATRTPQEPT